MTLPIHHAIIPQSFIDVEEHHNIKQAADLGDASDQLRYANILYQKNNLE